MSSTFADRVRAELQPAALVPNLIAGLVVGLGVFGVFPMLLLVPLICLEILIAFLQAYVFAILTCLYINDALNLH